MTEVSIVGGSGFTGGEVLRLVAGHPEVELKQVTSRSEEKRAVTNVHPNLRGLTDTRFVHPDDLEAVDLLFTATPHGFTRSKMPEYLDLADTVIDLSGDYRLGDADVYAEWYDEHPNPDLLDEAVYGIPEINREEIRDARIIASAGCNATASILGLYPLVENDLVENRIVVDVKTSSSAGGASPSQASHHSERSRVVRPYAPTSHRHVAEVRQETGRDVMMTVHAIEMVRGLSATIHAFPSGDVEERDLWKAYRGMYGDEEFVRVTVSKRGLYRYPEPKIVEGTNYCDVGFAVGDNRIVAFSALDNMMKGAAGMAVQDMNIALGLDESTGLEFPGLHPV